MSNNDPLTPARFRLSQHLCRYEWRGGMSAVRHVLVAHPYLGTRASLAADVAAVLDRFAHGPVSLASVAAQVDAPPDVVSSLFGFFAQQGFVVPEGANEEEAFLREFQDQADIAQILATNQRAYRTNATLTFQQFATARSTESAFEDLRVLILGGCLTQFAADEIEKIAPTRGFRARVTVAWPDTSPDFAAIDPHLVVLQLSTTWLLAPVWDELPFLDDAELERRVDIICRAIDASLDSILPRCHNKLLLVHNFSSPHTSPLGVTEFRRNHSFPSIVHQLNQQLARRLRTNANAMVVDEEGLASAIGKSRLFDDAVAVYGHHAPIDFHCGVGVPGPTRFEVFDVRQSNHLATLLATHYLDLFQVWRGIGRIKCVVVDLDETLWPGSIGDEGFSFESDVMFQTLKYGWHGGVHQALKILKSRGILLASCSKNDEADAFSRWEQLERYADGNGLGHVLRRADFVAHTINWERKSKNLRTIMQRLGCSSSALAFIDDDPVERAEVRQVFPDILALGDVPNVVRHELLTHPAFQINVETAEAKRRTDTTAAQLTRDDMSREAADVSAFLRSLDIELRIRRLVVGDALQRVVDLIQRANQFNTRGVRHDVDAVMSFVANPQAAVYTLSVKDRFAEYGLVGVLIYDGSRVDTFVMSCRVIGLSAAVPFLVETIRREQHRLPISGQVVRTPRNEPCRHVFRDAGFTECDGAYLLHEMRDVTGAPPGIYRVLE